MAVLEARIHFRELEVSGAIGREMGVHKKRKDLLSLGRISKPGVVSSIQEDRIL